MKNPVAKYFNTADTHGNHIKNNCMKMINFLKVKIKNLLKKLRKIQRKKLKESINPLKNAKNTKGKNKTKTK